MAFQSKKTNSKGYNLKIISIISGLLVLSSVGSIVGTYSWYEYTIRAGLNYHGTAVGDASGLQIGLYSQNKIYHPENFDLIEDKNRNGLYWSTTKGLSNDAILYFAYINGYAGNVLQPVTSGEYHRGDALKLNNAPTKLDNYDINKSAYLAKYTRLPLAFRIDGDNKKLTNERVLLTNISFEGEGNIKNGLRIHVNNLTDKFIFNPTEQNSGEDIVGGTLDLDMDGFLDHKIDSNGNDCEYIYGEVDGETTYYEDVSSYTEPVPMEERDTFNGVSAENVYAVDKSKTSFKKASYLGCNDVINSMPLGFIDETANCICVSLAVYAEGWSPFVSFTGYREQASYFNLTMDFELWSA